MLITACIKFVNNVPVFIYFVLYSYPNTLYEYDYGNKKYSFEKSVQQAQIVVKLSYLLIGLMILTIIIQAIGVRLLPTF